VQRREIRLDDGRYLIFYTFDEEPQREREREVGEERARAEQPSTSKASDV